MNKKINNLKNKDSRNLNLFGLALLVILFSSSSYGVLPDFTELVEKAAPAVVKINTNSVQNNSDGGSFQRQMPDIFRELLDPRRRPSRPAQTMGSGFVISSDGFILTNHHVVADADEIQVQFADRSEYTAEIIGSDRRSDLALLKIDATNLRSLKLSDEEKVMVGSWVIAIGSPFNLDYSVAAGIVSALGRSLPTEQGENYVPFIQTDVAINRGNSGGPLLNLEGEVVGINSQIYSPTGGSVGLSFSIPSNIAINVVEQLKKAGKVSRGFLGVAIADVTKEDAKDYGLPGPMGAEVSEVTRGSAAEKGGIVKEDIIVGIDGNPILRSEDLPHIVGLITPGTRIDVEVYREGKKRTLSVEVGSLDADDDIRLAGNISYDRLGLVVEEIGIDQARENRIRSGLVIVSVEPNSPAEEAGLKVDDIIAEIGYQRIEGIRQYEGLIRQLPKQKSIPLLVLRGGRPSIGNLEIN